MNHDAFSTFLLLGTGRLKTPPPAPLPVLEDTWSALDWSQPEAAALSACALRAAATGAGFVARSGFPDEPLSATESRPTVPAGAGSILRRIFTGEAPECLTEWLERCAAGGFIAAPRDLPALFERASREKEIRAPIAAVMGERGAWLARREGLAELFPVDGSRSLSDEDWETGTLPERAAWLRAMRSSDPARAAAALTAVWPQESGETRLVFLTVIGDRPTDHELPLLETTALKDRRREVRQLARGALLSRPACGFVSRQFARAETLLRLEGKLPSKHLVLDLPENYDPAWKDDGIEEKAPAGLKRSGQRGFWALQLLGLVPLSLWTTHFQVDPEKLLALNKNKDHSHQILLGWLTAALANPEPASAEALARHLAGLDRWPLDAPQPVPTFLRLLSVLPDSAAAGIVETAESGVLRNFSPGQLFSASRFPVPLADAPRWLTAILAGLRAKPWPIFQSPTARSLALRLPMAFLPEALRHLAAEESLSSPAEAFSRVLEFRLQLHEAFPPPGKKPDRSA